MGVLARLFDFVAGTRITSANVDAELNQLVTGHNDHETLLINLAAGTGLTDGVVTSAKIADGTLMNVDVNNSAAIAWSKISKSGSSIADLATKSAADLTSGTLDVARLPTAIPATSIGGGSVDDTEFSYVNGASSNLQTQITARQVSSEKGQASGYAELDSGGKVPLSQIPDSVVGQLEFINVWNATTNTPTLPDPTTVKGNFYKVSVAGTYLTVAYGVGDLVISNGTIWEKLDQTESVSTVFGRAGAILAATNDYTWAQVDKTTSSIADITTRSAADLSSGTLAAARMPALTGSDVSSTAGTVALTLSDKGTAGTYKSVTTDAKGRVTAGTNPTTLAGFGITDAAPLSHVGAAGSAHPAADASNPGFMTAAHYTKVANASTLITAIATPADVYNTFGGRFKQGYNSTTDSFDTIEF